MYEYGKVVYNSGEETYDSSIDLSALTYDFSEIGSDIADVRQFFYLRFVVFNALTENRHG